MLDSPSLRRNEATLKMPSKAGSNFSISMSLLSTISLSIFIIISSIHIRGAGSQIPGGGFPGPPLPGHSTTHNALPSYLSGEITEDRSLISAASPYYVTADLKIPAGVTFSIGPGVMLYANPAVSIHVHGALVAEGTQLSPVQLRLNRNTPRVSISRSGSPIVRLANTGLEQSSGILKVIINNVWVDVCDKRVRDPSKVAEWGAGIAKVVCRDLGFAMSADARVERASDPMVARGTEAMTHWDCAGNETSFRTCRLQRSGGSSCDPREDALRVVCESSWPQRMHWGGIRFHSSAQPSTLQHVVVSEAGIQREDGSEFPYRTAPSIHSVYGTVSISDTVVEDGGGSGVGIVSDEAVVVRRLRLIRNAHHGLDISLGKKKEATIDTVVAEDNRKSGISIEEVDSAASEAVKVYNPFCTIPCTWCRVTSGGTEGHSYIMNVTAGHTKCLKTFSGMMNHNLGLRVMGQSGDFSLTVRDGPSVLSAPIWNRVVKASMSSSAIGTHALIMTESEWMTVELGPAPGQLTGFIQFEIFSLQRGQTGVVIGGSRLTANRQAGLLLEQITTPVLFNNSESQRNTEGIKAVDILSTLTVASSRVSRNSRDGVTISGESSATFSSINSVISHNGARGVILSSSIQCGRRESGDHAILAFRSLMNVNVERSTYESNNAGGLLLLSSCRVSVNVVSSRFSGGYFGVGLYLGENGDDIDRQSSVTFSSNTFSRTRLAATPQHPWSGSEFSVLIRANHSASINLLGNNFEDNNATSVIRIASDPLRIGDGFESNYTTALNVTINQNTIINNRATRSVVDVSLRYNPLRSFQHRVVITRNSFLNNYYTQAEPYFVSTLQSVSGILHLRAGDPRTDVTYNFFDNPSTQFALVVGERNTSNSVDARRCFWGSRSRAAVRGAIHDGSTHFILPEVEYWPWLTAMDITRVSTSSRGRVPFLSNEVLGGVLPRSQSVILSEGIYHVVRDIQIENGATLTIEAGATIYFNPGLGMRVSGKLNARGTVRRPIRFSSLTPFATELKARISIGTSGFLQIRVGAGWVNACKPPINPLSVPTEDALYRRDKFFCNVAGYGNPITPSHTMTSPAGTIGGVLTVPVATPTSEPSLCFDGHSLGSCTLVPALACGAGGFYAIACDTGPFAGIHFTAEADDARWEHVIMEKVGTMSGGATGDSESNGRDDKMAASLQIDFYRHNINHLTITGTGSSNALPVVGNQTEARENVLVDSGVSPYAAIRIKKVKVAGMRRLLNVKVNLEQADVGLAMEDDTLKISNMNITVGEAPSGSWATRVVSKLFPRPYANDPMYRDICLNNGSDLFLRDHDLLYHISDWRLPLNSYCSLRLRSPSGYRIGVQIIDGDVDESCAGEAFALSTGWGTTQRLGSFLTGISKTMWTSMDRTAEVVLSRPMGLVRSCIDVNVIIYSYRVSTMPLSYDFVLSTSGAHGFSHGFYGEGLTGNANLLNSQFSSLTSHGIKLQGGTGQFVARSLVALTSVEGVQMANYSGEVTIESCSFGQGRLHFELAPDTVVVPPLTASQPTLTAPMTGFHTGTVGGAGGGFPPHGQTQQSGQAHAPKQRAIRLLKMTFSHVPEPIVVILKGHSKQEIANQAHAIGAEHRTAPIPHSAPGTIGGHPALPLHHGGHTGMPPPPVGGHPGLPHHTVGGHTGFLNTVEGHSRAGPVGGAGPSPVGGAAHGIGAPVTLLAPSTTISVEDCSFTSVKDALRVTTADEPLAAESAISSVPETAHEGGSGQLNVNFYRNTVRLTETGLAIVSESGDREALHKFGSFNFEVMNNTFNSVTNYVADLHGGGHFFGNAIVSSRFTARALVKVHAGPGELLLVENNRISYCAGETIIQTQSWSAGGFSLARNTFERNYVSSELMDVTLLRDDILNIPSPVTLNLFATNARFAPPGTTTPCPLVPMITFKGTKRISFTRNVLRENHSFARLVRASPPPAGAVNEALPLDFTHNYWGQSQVSGVALAVDYNYHTGSIAAEMSGDSSSAHRVRYVPFYSDAQLSVLSNIALPASASGSMEGLAPGNRLFGRLNANLTLDAGEYTVSAQDGDLILPQGISLVLLPGVIIRVGQSSSIKVLGRLECHGSQTNPIRIEGTTGPPLPATGGSSGVAGASGLHAATASGRRSCLTTARLVNGTSGSSGLLQVRQGGDQWDNVAWRVWLPSNSLGVVCRELGYSTVAEFTKVGEQPATVDLFCSGSENRATDCNREVTSSTESVYLRCASETESKRSRLLFDSHQTSVLRHTQISNFHHVAVTKEAPRLEHVLFDSIEEGVMYGARGAAGNRAVVNHVTITNGSGLHFYGMTSGSDVAVSNTVINNCTYGLTFSDQEPPEHTKAWFASQTAGFSFCGPAAIITLPAGNAQGGSGSLATGPRFHFMKRFGSPWHGCQISLRAPMGQKITLVLQTHALGDVADVRDKVTGPVPLHGVRRRFVKTDNATALTIQSHSNAMTVTLLIRETDVEFATLYASSIYSAHHSASGQSASQADARITVTSTSLGSILHTPALSFNLTEPGTHHNILVSSVTVSSSQSALTTPVRKASVKLHLSDGSATLRSVSVEEAAWRAIDIEFSCNTTVSAMSRGMFQGMALNSGTVDSTVGGALQESMCRVELSRCRVLRSGKGGGVMVRNTSPVQRLSVNVYGSLFGENTGVSVNGSVLRLEGLVSTDLSYNLFHNNRAGSIFSADSVRSVGTMSIQANTFWFNTATSPTGGVVSLRTGAHGCHINENVFMNPVTPTEVALQNGMVGPVDMTHNYWRSPLNVLGRIADRRMGPPPPSPPSYQPILDQLPPTVQYSEICPFGWEMLGSHCYLYGAGAVQYGVARHLCEQEGGSLLVDMPMPSLLDALQGRQQGNGTSSRRRMPTGVTVSASGGVWLLSSGAPRECRAFPFVNSPTSITIVCSSLNSYICERSVGGVCPSACFLRGMCRGSRCVCQEGWRGSDCSVPDCAAVSDCHGHGACIGPSQCECTAGWSGRACSVSACNIHQSCSACTGDTGCGWCDTTRSCTVGKASGPAIPGTCTAWFYRGCITVKASSGCSSEIGISDCKERHCGHGSGSSAVTINHGTTGSQNISVECSQCMDLDRCYRVGVTTGPLLSDTCFTWDENACPAGRVSVDYANEERVQLSRLSDALNVVDPTEATLYACDISLSANPADQRKVFVVPSIVNTFTGEVLASGQAGGVLHRVVQIKPIGSAFKLVVGTPAGVEDILTYADFSQPLPLQAAEDERTGDQIFEAGVIAQAKAAALRRRSEVQDVTDVLQHKALGRVYGSLSGGSTTEASIYLVIPFYGAPHNLSTGDIVVSTRPMRWLETVRTTGTAGGSNRYAQTTLFQPRPYTGVWRTPVYSMLDRGLRPEMACKGGDSRAGMLFFNSATGTSPQIDIRTGTVIPGREAGPVLGQVRSIRRRDMFVYVEVLLLSNMNGGYTTRQLRALRVVRSSRARPKRQTTIVPSLNHLYKEKLELPELSGLTLFPSVSIRQALSVSLRMDRDDLGQVQINRGGIGLSGDLAAEIRVEGSLKPTLTSANGMTLSASVTRHQAVHKFYLDVAGVPVPGQLTLSVTVGGSIQTTGRPDIDVTLTSQSTIVSSVEAKADGSIVPTHQNTNLVGVNASVVTQEKGKLTLSIHPALMLVWPLSGEVKLPGQPVITSSATSSPTAAPSILTGLSPDPVTNRPSEWRLSADAPSSLEMTFTGCSSRCTSSELSTALTSEARVEHIGTSFYTNIARNMERVFAYNPTGDSFLSQTVCVRPKAATTCCSCQAQGGEPVPGVRDDNGQCLCDCFCDPGSRQTPGLMGSGGECRCDKCPNGSLRKFWREIPCPCVCPDGRERPVREDGTCDCACRCADGTLSQLGPTGECDCSCTCNDCTLSVKGETGCICQSAVCPPCPGGEDPVWTDCECQCPPSPCGPPGGCAPGRSGPNCDMPNCPGCAGSCNHGNGVCVPVPGGCEAQCMCSKRWGGTCCSDPIPLTTWGGFAMETLDGQEFSVRDPGEYWACRSPTMGMGYQIRLFRSASGLLLIGGVAVRVGDSVLTMSTMGQAPVLRLDGTEMLLTQSSSMTVGRGQAILSIQPSFDRVTDVLASVSMQQRNGITLMLNVHYQNSARQMYMSVTILPSESMMRTTSGLCGFFDNNKFNDLISPFGHTVTETSQFVNHWRITTPRRIGGMRGTWSWIGSNFHSLDPTQPINRPGAPARSSPALGGTTTTTTTTTTTPAPATTATLMSRAREACAKAAVKSGSLGSCILNAVLTNFESVSTNNALQGDCDASCSGRGLCRRGRCRCLPGWSGSRCTTGVCGTCDSSHGKCSDGFCQCDRGWTGSTCSRQATCPSVNQCSGHGDCIDDNVCECSPGYVGGNCANVADCSVRRHCSGNGRCVGVDTCQCNLGYKGADCSFPSCGGLAYCSGHGECMGYDACVCDSGWKGLACSEPDCSPVSECAGHGTCTGPAVCSCNIGWTGGHCSVPTSCPKLSDCHGHGVCILAANISADPSCQCFMGYKGVDCSQPSCASVADCSGHGRCWEPGLCSCDYGYTGPNCDTFSCESKARCSGNGRCVAFETCVCDALWSGEACDRAECSVGTLGCSEQGVCVAPDVCQCYPGYGGAGCMVSLPPNAHTPQFADSAVQNITLSEGAIPGVGIMTLTAQDLDEGRNGNVEYSVRATQRGEDLSDHFIVGTRTGAVVLIHSLPPGASNRGPVALTVTATDEGRPPRQDQVSSYIQLNPVNHHCPVFTTPQVDEIIMFNKTGTPDAVVTVVRALDMDPHSRVFFSAASEHFSVSGGGSSATGLITLRSPSLPPGHYPLTIIASDSGSPPCSASLKVHILSYDSNIPAIVSQRERAALVQHFTQEIAAISSGQITTTPIPLPPSTVPPRTTQQRTTAPRQATTTRRQLVTTAAPGITTPRPATMPAPKPFTTASSAITRKPVITTTPRVIPPTTKAPPVPTTKATIAPVPGVTQAPAPATTTVPVLSVSGAVPPETGRDADVAAAKEGEEGKSGMIAIIGSAVGLLLVILIVGIIVYVIIRKSRRRRHEQDGDGTSRSRARHKRMSRGRGRKPSGKPLPPPPVGSRYGGNTGGGSPNGSLCKFNMIYSTGASLSAANEDSCSTSSASGGPTLPPNCAPPPIPGKRSSLSRTGTMSSYVTDGEYGVYRDAFMGSEHGSKGGSTRPGGGRVSNTPSHLAGSFISSSQTGPYTETSMPAGRIHDDGSIRRSSGKPITKRESWSRLSGAATIKPRGTSYSVYGSRVDALPLSKRRSPSLRNIADRNEDSPITMDPRALNPNTSAGFNSSFTTDIMSDYGTLSGEPFIPRIGRGRSPSPDVVPIPSRRTSLSRHNPAFAPDEVAYDVVVVGQ